MRSPEEGVPGDGGPGDCPSVSLEWGASGGGPLSPGSPEGGGGVSPSETRLSVLDVILLGLTFWMEAPSSILCASILPPRSAGPTMRSPEGGVPGDGGPGDCSSVSLELGASGGGSVGGLLSPGSPMGSDGVSPSET